MPSSVIYFGAPIKGKKAVPPDVRSLGLDLLPAAPSQVVVEVANQYSQPNFSIYANSLSLHVIAAAEKRTVSLNESIYQNYGHTQTPGFEIVPMIIWSYNYALSPEQKNEVKVKFDAAETEAQGKTAFTRKWKDSVWWGELKKEGSINRHTATNSTNMNMAGFTYYVISLRIIDQFMRVNRYAAFKDNQDNGAVDGHVHLADTKLLKEEDFDMAQVKSHKWADNPPKLRIYNNSNKDFATTTYTTSDFHSIPADHTGIAFPYIKALSTPDNQIFARVFSRYFMGFLGSSREEALDMLESLKASWGNICRTDAGFEMAHMLRVIEISLQAQSFCEFTKNHSNQYSGAIILGGMFSLKVNGSVFVPEISATVVQHMKDASAHESSIDFILSKLVYSGTDTATTIKPLIRSLRDLSFVVRSRAYSALFEAEMIKKAYHISFRGDGNYLSPTSHNLTTILTAMADPNIPETNFPIHPEAVFSQDRDYRLLSAFGITVPDFLVPGGKKMSLEGNFTVREDGPAGKQTRDVHKVAVVMKDLKSAYADLLSVKKDKAIMNPFGNKLGSAASYNSSGLVTRFEGDHARDVLAALRRFTGAKENVANPKRLRDEDEEDKQRSKKSKLYEV